MCSIVMVQFPSGSLVACALVVGKWPEVECMQNKVSHVQEIRLEISVLKLGKDAVTCGEHIIIIQCYFALD